MDRQKRIAALIPAYNCGHVIRPLIKKIKSKKIFDFIIVVDDCSSDNTFEASSGLKGVFVFRNTKNLGYGGTSIELYRKAREFEADFTVNFHGDGGHKIDALAPIASDLLSKEADIVVASRLIFLKNQLATKGWQVIVDDNLRGNMPLVRFIGHLFLTHLQNKALNLNLSSYHEGMRGCSAPAVNWILSQKLPSWYQFDNMLLSLAAKDGLKINEIPCIPNYDLNSKSSAPPFRYGMAVLSLIFKLKKRFQK